MDIYGDVVSRLGSLGYTATDEDGWAINFLISKAAESIKSGCNTADVPEGLRYVAADMVCGELLQMKKAAGRLEGYDAGAAVRQISEGDTSVTYAVPDGAVTIDSLIAYLINHGKPQLASYRRLTW